MQFVRECDPESACGAPAATLLDTAGGAGADASIAPMYVQ